MVDPIACDGRGICAELLPGLITLDDWGFPIIHGDVPPALRDEAAEAVRLCPKLALRLTAERAAAAPERAAAGRLVRAQARGRRWSRPGGPLAPRRRLRRGMR